MLETKEPQYESASILIQAASEREPKRQEVSVQLADRIRAESNLPTDGPMTGLSVMVFPDAGVVATDPRIQAAANWLQTNQWESGRWWTRSLKMTPIASLTFSRTGYALLLPAKCDAL